MKRFIVLIIAVFLLLAPESFSQDRPFGIGLIIGYHEPLNAGESYKAVYNSGGGQYGILFDYRIIEWLDLDLRLLRFTKSGFRVLIGDNGEVVETNNPEDLEILSITAGARWIFIQDDEYAPYLGASLGSWSISTESTIGDYRQSYDKTGIGFMVMAGVQLFQNKPFSMGIDLSYSTVPDMIGSEAGSTSYYYGETDIGGLSINFAFQYRF